MARGMNEQVEKWKKYMETWMLPYPYIDPKGEKKAIWYQCNLKPIQLWGYTFPHEQKDLVLSSLGFADETSNIGWLHSSPQLGILRKLLKCKKIKDHKKVLPYYLGKEFVQLMPIGIRDDELNHKYPNGIIREFL